MTKTNSDIGKQNSRGNRISLMEGSLRQHELQQQEQQQQQQQEEQQQHHQHPQHEHQHQHQHQQQPGLTPENAPAAQRSLRHTSTPPTMLEYNSPAPSSCENSFGSRTVARVRTNHVCLYSAISSLERMSGEYARHAMQNRAAVMNRSNSFRSSTGRNTDEQYNDRLGEGHRIEGGHPSERKNLAKSGIEEASRASPDPSTNYPKQPFTSEDTDTISNPDVFCDLNARNKTTSYLSPRPGNHSPNKKRSRVKKAVQISSDPPIEMFRPSSDAYTPRVPSGKKIQYCPVPQRNNVESVARTSSMGTIHRPNFRDVLRRVAMVLQQHVVKIERRFEALQHTNPGYNRASSGKRTVVKEDRLFLQSMLKAFSEDNFASPRYKCTLIRMPVALGAGVTPFCMQEIKNSYKIPTVAEIFDFMHQLFRTVQLSSECSIVSLIYIERLMENAKMPLSKETNNESVISFHEYIKSKQSIYVCFFAASTTWRPVVLCGLLLASKVWQDLSTWNIEFASFFPQYPLESINKLEALFLKSVKWDLYISSSVYAKYYFALRSLLEKSDFRHRYNLLVNVDAPLAMKVQNRTSAVKEEVLSQLSRSM
uniref:Cyclin N-terminal domain-containing protein n=2 Tax=Corethron hystrix TaxID=216773 RepID=A0A7S1B497_9STRA|mmetsp:Transcript_11908/g.26108  ORF Transcript_11908/g.26108 Transcript_11908/m.26108 type:complete len:594 (+) Transcript_11908:1430-3211(+)